MTRSWTDPRTGKRWHIDVVVRKNGGRGPAPRQEGPHEAPSALVFDSREGSFAFPTEDATRLEALEDDKLAELLDLAKEASTPPEPKKQVGQAGAQTENEVDRPRRRPKP